MHFCIEEKDVEKQFDCESFCLYKAGGFMHYMTKGGYHVFVKPDYQSLYGTLEIVLDLLIKTAEKPEEERNGIKEVAEFISTILFAPTVLFANEEIMFKAFEHITDFTKELLEQSESELKNEDFDKNNDFESAVKSAEETIEKLKEISEAMPEDMSEE